jgi:hypothetical protein
MKVINHNDNNDDDDNSNNNAYIHTYIHTYMHSSKTGCKNVPNENDIISTPQKMVSHKN